jgi:hypothetical protein
MSVDEMTGQAKFNGGSSYGFDNNINTSGNVSSASLTVDAGITINNNSKNNISCFISKVDLNHIKNISEMSSASEIKSNDFAFLAPITRGTWEEYIEKCDAKKARIYIIVKDSIDKYGWENIYKNNIYNKKYMVTIEDLEKTNWQIEYP